MLIKCIDCDEDAFKCNARLAEIELWLKEFAGERWECWNWGGFGMIEFDNCAVAVMFKLRFGL